jgi:hypothetical protein
LIEPGLDEPGCEFELAAQRGVRDDLHELITGYVM